MADNDTPTSQTVAAGQLRAFVERIERLEEDKKAIADDIKALRTIVRLRKKDQAEREEEESILDLYKAALGME